VTHSKCDSIDHHRFFSSSVVRFRDREEYTVEADPINKNRTIPNSLVVVVWYCSSSFALLGAAISASLRIVRAKADRFHRETKQELLSKKNKPPITLMDLAFNTTLP
jgi:hypothetical protein